MADRFTANQLIEMGQRNISNRIIRTATIDNDAITATDITDRVAEWGKTKFEVYNKHPSYLGKLRFPLITLGVKNWDRYFDFGGPIFPNGNSDLSVTTVQVKVTIEFSDGTLHTVLDFTGQVREPEFDESGQVELIVEHALTVLSGRLWGRRDRIGGDTGIDFYFNS